jgi:hypothetical protein
MVYGSTLFAYPFTSDTVLYFTNYCYVIHLRMFQVIEKCPFHANDKVDISRLVLRLFRLKARIKFQRAV